MEGLIQHPLNVLGNVSGEGGRFAELADEMIAFERNGAIFDLFGAGGGREGA